MQFALLWGLWANPGDTVLTRQDPVARAMILPLNYSPLETRTSLSVLFTKLPYDWIETSVEVPVFQVTNKTGLPFNLTLESSIQSIIVSNQVRTGPHRNFEMGRFSFGAGIDFGLMFGRMTIAGFNNSATGWATYPGLTAGYKAGNMSFAMNAEMTFINSLRISSGSEEIVHSRNYLSGAALSFFMEQPLWKDHMIIIGIINNFQKFWYPAWPAFSTFNRHYYIPQFHLGLVL